MTKPSEAEKAAAAARREEANARADAVVKPLSREKWAADYGWNGLESALAGWQREYGLCLEPEFQRGHVWTQAQQSHFIENVLRGIVSEAGLVIQFNAPHWDDHTYNGELPREIQCVDGLQRLTAVRKYVAGELQVFGKDISFFEHSRYDARRLNLFRLRFAIHTFQTKAELIGYYLDINAGGTPHSQAELERVRALVAGSVAA